MENNIETQVREKLSLLAADLAGHFAGMNEVAEALILGAVAGQHVCLLGDPGVAKTAITQRFAAGIDGRYWYRNVDESTMPTQLFGGLNMSKAMKTGEEEHMTAGHFPDAHIVLLDEAFKCNSMSLNSLLPVLNERVFVNNGKVMNLPLQMCVAASNEYPRRGLAALWDRFPIRLWVRDVQGSSEWSKLWEVDNSKPQLVRLSILELEFARKQASKVDLGGGNGDVAQAFLRVVAELNAKGIRVSPRRVKTAQKLLQAQAWLTGDTQVSPEHMVMLDNVLWDTHEQRADVTEVLSKYANSELTEFRRLTKAVQGILDTAPTNTPTAYDKAWTEKVVRILAEMKAGIERLSDMQGKMKSPKAKTEAQASIDAIVQNTGVLRAAVQKMMGMV